MRRCISWLLSAFAFALMFLAFGSVSWDNSPQSRIVQIESNQIAKVEYQTALKQSVFRGFDYEKLDVY